MRVKARKSSILCAAVVDIEQILPKKDSLGKAGFSTHHSAAPHPMFKSQTSFAFASTDG